MNKHENHKLLIDRVIALANKYYEPGNQSKSYKSVWRQHVYPVYPMCYRTFLNYLNYADAKIKQAD